MQIILIVLLPPVLFAALVVPLLLFSLHAHLIVLLRSFAINAILLAVGIAAEARRIEVWIARKELNLRYRCSDENCFEHYTPKLDQSAGAAPGWSS
jgi:hypothetical protein